MKGRTFGHGKTRRANSFFSIAVYASCLVLTIAVASLFLKGYTYSWINSMLAFVLVLIVEWQLVMRRRKDGMEKAFVFRLRTVGAGIRAAAALLIAGGLTALFYHKYFAVIFSHSGRYGKLAGIYDGIALSAPVKTGLLLSMLTLLFLICWLNIYTVITAACLQAAGGTAADAPRRPVFCWKRYFQMALVLFSLFFTVVFFGPVDIVLENGAYLYIQSRDFWFVLLGVSVCAALSLALPVGLMNAEAFRLFLCLAFGLTIATYFQGTFDRLNLGRLDGTAIAWGNYSTAAILGGMGWLLAVMAQLIANRLFFKHYVKFAVYTSMAIIAMQLTALLTMIGGGVQEGSRYVLDGAETFTVSSKENIVVFTLDRLSNTTMERAMEQYPEINNELRDFTYFDNTSQRYKMTFPSLTAMMTGEEYDPQISSLRYTQKAWSGSRASLFYGMLKDRNFRRNLFVDENYAAIDAEVLFGKADNVVDAPIRLTAPLLLELIKLSAYRYMPLCAKEAFWTTTEDLNAVTRSAESAVIPLATDYQFYQRLLEQGLRVSDDKNRFSWHHLNGAHTPHVLAANGLPAGHETDMVTQTRGYLVAIAEYLRQMKALGIYDTATIILSADHGYNPTEPQIILFVKRPHQTRERLEVRHAPAAQMDILPTIFDCLEEPYTELGTSVFDLSEGQARVRTTSYFEWRNAYPAVKWIGARGLTTEGDAHHFNVLADYDYAGDRRTIAEKIESGAADRVVPLYETYY